MDAKLMEIIERVKSLSKKYPDFREEMERFFSNRTNTNVDSDNKISKIVEYLGLDVYVDNMDSIVDYSFIKEKNIRDKLISDNREMIRFRYGTRYHEIKFEEYCRYAQFQVEMLLNYFYYQKFKTIDKIKEHIKKHNDSRFYEAIDGAKTLPAISFLSKIWAFANEFDQRKIIDTLDFISRVRNGQSHRSPEEHESSFFDQYKKKLKDLNIELNDDGYIDFKKLNNNKTAKKAFCLNIEGSSDFKKYQFYLWQMKQPYDDVNDVIHTVVATLRTKL